MTLTLVVVTLILVVAYGLTLGRRFAACAPTAEERTRTMAGDAIIPNPTHSAMDAVTIDASPMTSGRGSSNSDISAAGCIPTTGWTDSSDSWTARARDACFRSSSTSLSATSSASDHAAS